MDDTKKELERLEQELLKDEDLDPELLTELLQEEPVPAFDDPNTIHTPKEPMKYRNYSNNYGKDKEEPAKKQIEYTQRARERDNRTILGLLITACVLCLCIAGILIFWLEVLGG